MRVISIINNVNVINITQASDVRPSHLPTTVLDGCGTVSACPLCPLLTSLPFQRNNLHYLHLPQSDKPPIIIIIIIYTSHNKKQLLVEALTGASYNQS